MELAVESKERIGVCADKADSVRLSRQIFDVVGGQTGGTETEQQRFQALTHLVDLFALFKGEPGHPRACVGNDGHEALMFEQTQGFAHRYAARTEPVGDHLLPDPRSGGEVAVKDLISKQRRDPRSRVTFTGTALLSSVDRHDRCVQSSGCPGCQRCSVALSS